MLIGLLSGCWESEYEKAGKDFGSWVNKDPNKWTDTQKDYFNDFTPLLPVLSPFFTRQSFK